jgi:putative serine protease PepD
MWDPPKNEDDTPWPASSVPTPSGGAPPTTGESSPSTPAATPPSVTSAPPAPERSPFSMTPPPSTPPAGTTPSSPVAPPFVRSTGGTLPPPTPNRTLLGAPLPSAPVPPANVVQVETQTKRRRIWPLALLALFTIAASGLVSWAVATSVNDSETVATEPTEDASAASPVQAVEDTTTPTAAAPVRDFSTGALDLTSEPFALAAQAIRPSVVQLNLGESLGTGVIIDSDGTILTAAHVIGENTEVRVTFSDGSSVDGDIVGTHTPTDVAVVKVDPTGRNLVAAPLANGADVKVGQIAVAVGSPFGFDQTVTAGIISAVDRIVNGVSMVQTDAPINPGTSGGPLINLDGQVVGINDLIFTQSGTSAGVGFAISIDLAVIVADQLIAGVEPQLALLGVSTGPAPNGARGAQVGDVVGGSAADEAGLQVGDIVVGVNGVATRGSGDLRAQVIDNAPGTSIRLSILRNGQEIDLTAVLGETGLSS